MRLLTKEQAKEIFCPCDIATKCICERCMAFDEIHKEVSRENHSNGMQMIQECSRDRGYQEIRREGVRDSSSELLILDALYTCRSIYKEDL